MRMKIGLLALLSVGALSQAIAAEPPTEPAKSSTTTTTSAPAASSTASSSEQANPAKPTPQQTNGDRPVKLVAGDADAEARLKRLKAAGYRSEMHGNQLVFCRSEKLLGSRFDKKTCNTAEALDEQMNSGRDMTESTQRQGLSGGNPHGS